MYYQPEEIMEQYPLQVAQITRGRGGYLCETDQGTKLLAPYCGSMERARFLRQFLINIKDAGLTVEQILLTAEGEPLAVDAYGGKYLCKDAFTGSECSTRNREEMKEAVKILAFYHKLSEGCTPELPVYMSRMSCSKLQLYEKRARELRRVRNYMRGKKNKTEFEQRFLEHFPRFMAQAQEAAELATESEKGSSLLCHGDFNQHNILKTKEGWRIVHFEHLCCQNPMTDLSGFLRKMMEKNSWRTELGLELMNAYAAVQPVRPSDRHILYVMLRFPEKYWKLANHYANSGKSWLSERSVDKLNDLIAQEEEKEHFLKNLALWK